MEWPWGAFVVSILGVIAIVVFLDRDWFIRPKSITPPTLGDDGVISWQE
jgi:hypothetical protein